MAVGNDRPQFVLFGSSIVQTSLKPGGWGSTLAHLYDRKADIIVRGYAGWNSRNAIEVLNQIFPKDDVDAVVHYPALVVVYFGGNDAMQPHPSGLGSHVPLPDYVENMGKIALHLRSLSSETRTIFLTTPPVDEAMIHQCYGDGIHLTTEGSKLVTKEILKAIREAEWEPSLYWMSMEAEFSEDSPYYPISLDGKTTINVSHIISPSKLEWLDDNERKALSSNALVRIPF